MTRVLNGVYICKYNKPNFRLKTCYLILAAMFIFTLGSRSKINYLVIAYNCAKLYACRI